VVVLKTSWRPGRSAPPRGLGGAGRLAGGPAHAGRQLRQDRDIPAGLGAASLAARPRGAADSLPRVLADRCRESCCISDVKGPAERVQEADGASWGVRAHIIPHRSLGGTPENRCHLKIPERAPRFPWCLQRQRGARPRGPEAQQSQCLRAYWILQLYCYH
jgi:hypothetical protein